MSLNGLARLDALAVRYAAMEKLFGQATDAAKLASEYLRETAVSCSPVDGRDFENMQRTAQSIAAVTQRLAVVKAKVAELEELLPQIATAWETPE